MGNCTVGRNIIILIKEARVLLDCCCTESDEQYGYNVRDELISADEVSYAYDDIGNRTSAEGKTYTANNLNQYIAIDDFAPEYDADGNQTLIKTETGIWSVQYNAENRPIRWQSGGTVITMSFDRMGRRVEMCTMKDGAETLQRFVYDNYLCIQQLCGTDNALFQSYVWDPTEPIATRPLVFIPSGGEVSYYFHDGNKNVSDLVPASGAPIHYAYTPFGAPTASARSENPFTFSSEVFDNALALTYYNYRHYDMTSERFVSRDPSFEKNRFRTDIYRFSHNSPIGRIDILGLYSPSNAGVFDFIQWYWLGGGESVDLSNWAGLSNFRASIGGSINNFKEEVKNSIQRPPCTKKGINLGATKTGTINGSFSIVTLARAWASAFFDVNAVLNEGHLSVTYSCQTVIDCQCSSNSSLGFVEGSAICNLTYNLFDRFANPTDKVAPHADNYDRRKNCFERCLNAFFTSPYEYLECMYRCNKDFPSTDLPLGTPYNITATWSEGFDFKLSKP